MRCGRPMLRPAKHGRLAACPIIVTRPVPEAQHWVEQLRQRNFAAEALPLIEISPLVNAGASWTGWQTLQDYAAIMFVSGNAVTHFFQSNPALALINTAQAAINKGANINPGLRFMAPGPGTVAALLAAGIPALQIDAPALDAEQFDSEALWAVVGQRDWRNKRVLIVRGQSAASSASETSESVLTPGRDWIARRWQEAGAQLDFAAVYQRRAPRFSSAQLARIKAASEDGSVWLFSSSEALSYLPALPGISWSGSRAIATHLRIAEAARSAGWGVVLASRPSLDDIAASIESMLHE